MDAYLDVARVSVNMAPLLLLFNALYHNRTYFLNSPFVSALSSVELDNFLISDVT